MRRLILKMSVSIDGFVAGPNGEIDWIFRSNDAGATAWTIETLWQAGAHLMGSRTYQDMAAYWPTSTEPFAAPMNEIPKVVFSTKGALPAPSSSLTTRAFHDAVRVRAPAAAGSSRVVSPDEASWTNPRVAGRDLAADIWRLKEEPGKDLLAHGGAGFARSLVRLGLVDEYRLLIHPVVLGSGLALFSALPRPLDLRLASATAFDAGAVAHVYRSAS